MSPMKRKPSVIFRKMYNVSNHFTLSIHIIQIMVLSNLFKAYGLIFLRTIGDYEESMVWNKSVHFPSAHTE